MLAIQIISGSNFPSYEQSLRHDYYVTLHFGSEGIEFYRTAHSIGQINPTWHEVTMKSIDDFRIREKEQNRPLFLEYIKILIHSINERNVDEIIGETRVLLANLGPPQWYKLLKPESTITAAPSKEMGLLLFTLTLTDDTLGEGRIVGHQLLHEELRLSQKLQYSSLFLNFDLSPLSLIGADPLPGPLTGEVILDRHESVEVEAFTGTNSFGDKYQIISRGTLYLTDLRLLFLSSSIILSPPHLSYLDIPSVEPGDCRNESELLALRRTSFQIPLGSIQDIRYHPIDISTAVIHVVSRDSRNSEFLIRRAPSSKRRKVVMSTNASSHGLLQKLPSGYFLPDCEPINDQQKKLNYRSYRSGIQTDDLLPSVWCSRVVDEIIWRIREDSIWIKWAQSLRHTIEDVVNTYDIPEYAELDESNWEEDRDDTVTSVESTRKNDISSPKSSSISSSPWWKGCLGSPSLIKDYTRLDVEAGNSSSQWWLCTNNINYEICDTYPQTLVFPCSISDPDIMKASQERSRERLPTLVWIHPLSRVPLCRSAQPLVGLSKAPEFDKKLCLAIHQSCPTKLPLRIADARPFINAQANAIQGKGYENVSFFGGTTVAQLFFMDIQNIHVMRECLQKLRDSYTTLPFDTSTSFGLSGGGAGTGDTIATEATEQAVSKWLGHVSSVLRGAASVAESLLLGHPVLVHCSDGWDRTAQLTSLAQLFLDPHYRTIEGFLLLIEKEWVSFGHQFKHRLGKLTHKETSPVFLQFLDCVTQMITQFPSEFEFSVGLVEVIAKCTYSGYFQTFRQDSENLRNAELLGTISNFSNDFGSEDLDYTSVYCYVRLLLHSSIADLLLNPYYCSPEAPFKNIKYLRPRCSPSELVLWQQGLIPRHMNRFAGIGGGGRGGLSLVECEALSAGTYTRLLNYWNLHLTELPITSQARINLLCSKHRGRIFSISTPHQVTRRKARYTVLPDNVAKEKGLFTSSSTYLSIDSHSRLSKQNAATILQHWYHSIYLMNQVSQSLKECGNLSALRSVGDQIQVDQKYLTKLQKCLGKPHVKEILRVLVWTLFVSRTQLKMNLLAISQRQVSYVLEEIISDILDGCVTKEIYTDFDQSTGTLKLQEESRQSSSTTLQRQGSSSSASSSFAQKIMSKGAKKFNKMTKSLYSKASL